ncbi:MAG: NAD(P)-dependent oxidoreductase [Arenimonas sp.]
MKPISRVGFIGLGAMGGPMAGHLQAKGLLAVVGNRTPEKAVALAETLGVAAAKAPSYFSGCDAVVLCVSMDADVLQCCRDLAGVLAPGALVIDHSTVARETALTAAALLAEAGIAFLDAPVSGGVEGARNGKLSVMVGGDAEVLASAQELLSAYALRVTLMGPTGAGQATKAVNQVLVAGIAQAVCEGLAFGEALGLKPESLVPTLAAGAAGNWFLDKRGATMMAGQFTPGFKSALLLKDLRIVQAMADALGRHYSVVEQSLVDYAKLVDAGYGEEDTSALIRLKRAN